MRHMRRLSLILLVLVVPSLAAAEARVTTLSDFPITISYDSSDERVARRVADICSDAIPVLADQIGLGDVKAFNIVLIQDMAAFEREQGINLPSWGVAFALMDNQVMLVDVDRASNAWNTLETVIPHELSHLLVGQRVGPRMLPVWFVEGLAMWQSREWSLIDNWRLMESVWSNRAPHLGQIERGLPGEEARARDAYRVAYIGFTERFEDRTERLPQFLDEVMRQGEFAAGFESYFDEAPVTYYARLHEHLHRKYKTRLLLFQAGPLFSVLSLLFLFVLLRVRLRNRRKLREMEQREDPLSLDDRWNSGV